MSSKAAGPRAVLPSDPLARSSLPACNDNCRVRINHNINIYIILLYVCVCVCVCLREFYGLYYYERIIANLRRRLAFVLLYASSRGQVFFKWQIDSQNYYISRKLFFNFFLIMTSLLRCCCCLFYYINFTSFYCLFTGEFAIIKWHFVFCCFFFLLI